MHDWDLIKTYREAARSNSDADQKRAEKAFSELVHRHINLVFSAALRSLGGNRSLAEDVAQKTFSLLAVKAYQFSPSLSIVGWLYKTSCNISRDAHRAENRRRTRELEALQMHSHTTVDSSPDSDWEDIAPLLEQAMASLPENERVLILLRFFERKPFREVAESLQITEEATRMRASRALQKLRAFFSQRGVTISSIAIGNALLASAVTAAPAALITSLAAPLRLTTASIPLSFTTKWVLMTTLQKSAIVTIALLLAISAGSALQTVRKRQSLNTASTAKITTPTSATQSVALSSTNNTSATAIADTRLDRAIANLRLALTSEWPDRRLPMARLRDAIADFGPDRKAAVPILLEYLNGQRASRSLSAMGGAAYCLELLGTDASSAVPDLLILLGSGDLAIWNDFIPRVFVALSPDGAIIPDLLSLISYPPSHSGDQLIATLEKLFALNPAAADTHRERIHSLLEDRASRLTAALLLARMPGPKDPSIVPILTNALQATRRGMVVVDFIADQPVLVPHESAQDDHTRFVTLQALGEMGPAASNALPALLAFAENAPTNSPYNLRDLALVAIGKIDPTHRNESPDVALALFQHERTAEILQKAKSGTASFTDLTEGLRLENAANTAARALENHPEARAAIPALVEAVNNFSSDEAVDRLKELDPHILIDRVRAGDDRAIAEVARALGELGPEAAAALPHLRALLDATSPDHPEAHRIYALDKAIHKIDPTQPKLLYNFEDLDKASTALTTAIYSQNKTHSPVYDAYIQLFQDRNAVSRGHLLRFAEATKADPALHKIFTNQLLRDHPDLATDLTPLAQER